MLYNVIMKRTPTSRASPGSSRTAATPRACGPCSGGGAGGNDDNDTNI